MKRFLLTILAFAALAITASATDLTGKRIYVNPGHGSFGPNDRPMPTITYPNLASTGMPDTAGFYESNTNLWKCQYLGQRLAEAGATVVYSRTQSGPWPYQKVNGDYPDYTWTNYQNLPDYEQYNRSLSEICEEVEAGNFDLFISVHSNALSDGTTTNYPLFLYRGTDNHPDTFQTACYNFGQAGWAYRFDVMAAGIDPASYYSPTQANVRGDVSFMGSGSNATRNNGKTYYGYYGVLKHGTVGGLWEGYFHTYQPARHRALNPDYCHFEGLAYFRSIIDYFNADADTLGYILGTVKDMDVKMNHPLFKYSPRTNDQWLPCNGATVYLLSATGDTLQSYTVDQNYNGIFAFYDLQPGTYHLAASCDGYLPLSDDQRSADVVVAANATAYPMLYLRDTAWTPAATKMETYPDHSSGVTGLDGAYNFGAAQTTNFAQIVAGKVVRQVLVRDDNDTYILALDTTTGAHASYIYRINTLTGALIEEVSTAGTQGEFYPIYNIAFTADSILVGANYGENQYGDAQVKPGRQRGTFRTYYWNMNSLQDAPTPWISTQWSGNFYNANTGLSFAVSGELANATIYTDARTASATNIRLAQITTENMAFVAIVRNQIHSTISTTTFGSNYSAIASPNSDEELIFAGELKTYEMGFAGDGAAPIVHYETVGLHGSSAMKYAGKAVLASPIIAGSAVKGVNLINMTDGMPAPVVSTTNITLDDTTAYYSVKPLAQGKDIVVYVATDNTIYRYTTAGQAQPTFRNIYAYGLNLTKSATECTFRFTLNTAPTYAAVVVKDSVGDELARFVSTNTEAGQHEVAVAIENLPAGAATWGVEAEAPVVGNWAKVESVSTGLTRAFNAVNIYPETEEFGTIYVMNRAGAGSAANGMHIFNPDFTMQNTTPYKGQQSFYGSPYRLGIASDGWVFVGDWADNHSGVYAVDPADPANSHYNFFAGTQDAVGLWKNASGAEEGSSTPSVYVYGTGADTKLLVYNEDPGATLPTNGLCVYNIGQEDGSILHNWDGAPSAKITFAGQANTNGNVWGCSHGVWVSQHRNAGNNNGSATSLRFYTWDGECTFASHTAPLDEFGLPLIEGSFGSCFAVTPDESRVILRGVDSDLMVFDITWTDDTPTLTLAYRVATDNNADFGMLQMNWDYAGNLVVSGEVGVTLWAVPKDVNRCFTPAPQTQLFDKVSVTGLTLDIVSMNLIKGDSATLTATITPANATIQQVLWETSDANVVTVENGLVTAVGNGQAMIIATSADGGYSDTCFITVTTVLQDILLNAESVTIQVGETFQFAVTLVPEDAPNPTLAWTTSDPTIATIDDNGLLMALKPGTVEVQVRATETNIMKTATVTVESAPSALDQIDADKATKIFENGQVFILSNGKKYTLTGVRVE